MKKLHTESNRGGYITVNFQNLHHYNFLKSKIFLFPLRGITVKCQERERVRIYFLFPLRGITVKCQERERVRIYFLFPLRGITVKCFEPFFHPEFMGRAKLFFFELLLKRIHYIHENFFRLLCLI